MVLNKGLKVSTHKKRCKQFSGEILNGIYLDLFENFAKINQNFYGFPETL
jgi:hypothetical protein